MNNAASPIMCLHMRTLAHRRNTSRLMPFLRQYSSTAVAIASSARLLNWQMAAGQCKLSILLPLLLSLQYCV